MSGGSGTSGAALVGTKQGYRKLLAFQSAHDLVRLTYALTDHFPKKEQFCLTAQMCRAAVSVAANIVEGYSRGTTALFHRHVDISFGSCKELEYYFQLTHELKYLTDEEAKEALDLVGRTAYLLHSLLHGLKTKLASAAAEKRSRGGNTSTPSTPSTPSSFEEPS